MLSRLKAGLTRASAALLGLLLVFLVALDFVQVVMRYLLGSGWVWASDVSIILLLTLGWLGAGHLWLIKGHIAIDLGFDLSRQVRAAAEASLALAAIAGGIVLFPMTIETLEAYSFIDMPTLPVSAAVKYVPVAAGTAFIVIASALNLAILLVERDKPA